METRDYARAIQRLRYWCQTVLPAVYDDSLTYYELLAKIVAKLNEVVDSNNELAGYVADNTEDIRELQELFKKFVESGYEDYYEGLLEQWFRANAWRIYNLVCKQVYFGLTDDGHFCAYVPDTWAEVSFDTGMVFGRSDYGRLILQFDANGEAALDNTYSYSLNGATSDVEELVKQLAADLEITTRRGDSTFDTVFTNIDQTVSKAGGNV